jgi:hypothetical protein
MVSGAQARSVFASAIAVTAFIGCAEQPVPEPVVSMESVMEPTFVLRLDSERSELDEFEIIEDDDGVRIKTGPAGIAYRATDLVQSGDFQAVGSFVQYGAPLGYREAYGIFVGGRDLDSPDWEYTYLLVRPTGDVLVKRRVGEITETILDWTPHESVARVEEEGDEPENELAIRVVDGETRFDVNGITVHAMPTAQARPFGIAGLRVNHRLDVRVNYWRLEDASTESQ